MADFNCLIAGVGGQGTVLASKLLAAAAIEAGLFARTAETIGMAQRGGCVTSHVRMGAPIHSPLIPPGGADVIIAFEPAEGLRALPYLKKDGTVIACTDAVDSVLSSMAGGYYAKAMVEALKNSCPRLLLASRESLVAPEDTKALNIALLGAAAAVVHFPFSTETLEKTIGEKVNPRFLDMNRRAYARGFAYGLAEQP